MQIKYTNGIGWGSNMLKSSQEKLQRQVLTGDLTDPL